MTDVWPPLLLSLRIALIATALITAVGVPLAFAMSRTRFAGKSLVDALITVPLVLPPTVVGYLLIVLLGARGWIGQWLHRALGYSIMFRVEGAVLAAAVVALPMLYMPAKAAFAGVDRELEDVARLFGAGRLRTFWHVSLPLARRGVASGLILAFARALGEFGATLMVFGWQPGQITLPVSIYADYEQGQFGHATLAVIALSVLSVGLMMAYNRSTLAVQER
jgi:molybdate transport system permease protein